MGYLRWVLWGFEANQYKDIMTVEQRQNGEEITNCWKNVHKTGAILNALICKEGGRGQNLVIRCVCTTWIIP